MRRKRKDGEACCKGRGVLVWREKRRRRGHEEVGEVVWKGKKERKEGLVEGEEEGGTCLQCEEGGGAGIPQSNRGER